MQKKNQEDCTEATYIRVDLETGKSKDKIESKAALVYVSSCSDILARDLYNLRQASDLSPKVLRTDVQDGVSTLHVEISNDHGGQSDKTTISIRDCEKPASFKRQSPDVVISKADLPPIPTGAAERLALRSGAPEKSATLVRTSADGPAVGIRAGDLFVPLRADVPAADIIDQEVYHLDVFFCSDLLATATCVGCDNMASCCCCWCRGDFNEIEKKDDYLTHDKQINECGCF